MNSNDGCATIFTFYFLFGIVLFFVYISGYPQSSVSSSYQHQQPTKTTKPTARVDHYDYVVDNTWDRDGDGVDDEYEAYLAEAAYNATAHAIDQRDYAMDQLANADAEMREDEEEFKALMTDEAKYQAEWRATERAMIDEYLAPQRNSGQAQGASYITTNLNVRTGPSTNCPVLSTLRQNSTITPIYCNADCSWILLSGSGWVSASYVVSPPMELYVYTDIPACVYGSAPPVVEYVQPAPTVARPSCGGGCISPPSGCNIKGNVGYNSGERIYHVPGQAYYNETVIDTRYGERWFCTEYEAQAAGWRRAYQ